MRQTDITIPMEIGMTTRLFDTARVGRWVDGQLLSKIDGRRKALEVPGMVLPMVHSFLFHISQRVLVVRTPLPPGTPMAGITTSGSWPGSVVELVTRGGKGRAPAPTGR
ncbi:hypothetical protein Q1695_007773 [Nippostrongylus brasiliensis]|nr:hypothetical protein Q1695_007773 [Nippostrongylus brasiliensis]